MFKVDFNQTNARKQNICMWQVNLGADLVARGVHSLPGVDLLGNRGVHSQTRGVHSLPASFTKRNQWNKAVSEAEKLVSTWIITIWRKHFLHNFKSSWENTVLCSYTGWLPHIPTVCQGTPWQWLCQHCCKSWKRQSDLRFSTRNERCTCES